MAFTDGVNIGDYRRYAEIVLQNIKNKDYKTSEFLTSKVEDTYITKVIYQNPATILFWSDGTKTVSKCDENDTFDEEKGLILCIMKKVFPNKNIGTLLGMWASGSADTYGKNIITLKQARKTVFLHLCFMWTQILIQ